MPDENKSQEPELSLVPVSEKRTPMREMLTVLKETGDPELFKAFARDIIEREVAAARFGEDGQLARIFAGSGEFNGINGTQQGVSLAMTKIQLGRSWNMQPADAMEAINFINGRPSVATRYLSAKMQDAGVSWDIEWDEDGNGTCIGCHLHLKRWNPDSGKYDPIMGRVNGKEQQAVVSFTKKDADNAIIHEGGKQIKLSEKWNFKSWPQDMYFARCISRVRVRYAPNILSGILTREEAEDSGESTPSPAIGAGSERAAVASQNKVEEIGKRLAEAKASKAEVKAEPKPVETKTPPPATTGVNPVEAKADPPAEVKAEPKPDPPPAASPTPWETRQDMNKDLLSAKEALGPAEFDRIATGISWGKASHTDPKIYAVYERLNYAVNERLKAQVNAVHEGLKARVKELEKQPAQDAPLF